MIAILAGLSLVMLSSSVVALDVGVILRKCENETKVSMAPCILEVLEDLRPYFPDGIPEMDLPGMEPLYIGDVKVETADGASITNAEFLDMKMSGVSDFDISLLTIDYDNRISACNATFAELVLRGRYNLDAVYTPLHIKGSGTFWAILKNGKGYGTSNWIMENIDGKNTLQYRNTTLDFDISDVSMRLNNLFDGDETLEAAVNAFINENSGDLIAQFKPLLAKGVARIIEETENRVFKSIGLEKIAGNKYIKETFGIK